MSHGLGATQLRALELLEAAKGGFTPAELALELGCGERFARTVIESLAERGEIIVRKDDGRLRAWNRRRLSDHTWVMGLLEQCAQARRRPAEFSCPNCGHPIQLTAHRDRPIAH